LKHKTDNTHTPSSSLFQVDLNNKDEEFKAVYSKIHPDPSAVAKVPIFQDHETGVSLIESMVIADYLEHKYKSSGTQLLPDNPELTANIKLFIEIFNSTFTPAMFSLFQADTNAKMEEGRGRLAAAIRTIDRFLQERSQPGGPFFMGCQFSQAEVVTIPFIQRGIATLPDYRGIDVREIVGEENAMRMKEWMEAGLARPSLAATKPTDEVIRDGMRKFLVQMKDF
jgi:glutathione S-transferase